MVPRTSSGRGFKGAAAYYLHDKGADTAERVAYTATLNLANDSPRRAVAEMIYTAEHAQELKEAAGIKATGRKLEKPVYTFSLSWHPTEKPDFAQMREAGISALKALKMDHHQVLMVVHNDTEHPHIHLIVNRIDPNNGKAHGLNKDQLILSKWAQAYEKEYGKTWCVERVKNNEARQEQGRGKFIKDKKSQERDSRPEHDRRSKAISAAKAARIKLSERAKRLAQQAQQASKKGQGGAEQDGGRTKAMAAFLAQNKPPRPVVVGEVSPHVLNRLQLHQIEERTKLSEVYAKRRSKAVDAFEQRHGSERIDQTAKLDVINDRIKFGSMLTRAIDRAKGRDLNQERKELTAWLDQLGSRKEAMLTKIDEERSQAFTDLAKKQENEKLALNSRARQNAPTKPDIEKIQEDIQREPKRDLH
jgi:hypothetical protein